MIKFGTDGWRAKIAEEFTFSNVRLVTQAILNCLKGQGLGSKPFFIGYDNRFLSEQFALEAAKVGISNGIECHYSSESLPSPALSFAVKDGGASGGIMITASHNPPEYNGIKFKASYGGSSLPEMTNAFETELTKLTSQNITVEAAKGVEDKILRFDPKARYFARLKELASPRATPSAKITAVIDYMHGSSSGYLSELLKDSGIEVVELNADRDPTFGGSNPEPLPVNLEDLVSMVKQMHLEKRGHITVGFALDGDGDRIAAVDGSGSFINPHNIFAILLKHLVEKKRMTGEVVKTFNGSNLIERLTNKYGLTLHETPIGFKYICSLMLDRDILIGGEESGGIGIKGHIPERDGLLAALLLLEAIAAGGRSLKGILDTIMKELGFFYYDRIDLHLAEEKKLATLASLKRSPPGTFAGKKVGEIKDLDGTKLILDDSSWILFRASGTEPLLRIYAEGTSPDLVGRMLSDGESLTK